MKSFSKRTYQTHSKDIHRLDKKDLFNYYLPWCAKLANQFSRGYRAIGILDLNDLIQEANLSLFNSLERFDYEKVKDVPEPEIPAIMWKYIKKTIILDIRKAILLNKDGIKTVWNNGKSMDSGIDNSLTELFPSSELWSDVFLIPNETTNWDIERLGFGLDHLMREVLTDKERMIVEMSYGVDNPKLPMKEIAKFFGLSEGNIRKIKSRSIKKLKNFENNKK